MSRSQVRFRQVRLDGTALSKKLTRAANAPRKVAERERRDAKIIAKIKATKGGDYAPEVQSWITARTGKLWRQVKPADIKALTA